MTVLLLPLLFSLLMPSFLPSFLLSTSILLDMPLEGVLPLHLLPYSPLRQQHLLLHIAP